MRKASPQWSRALLSVPEPKGPPPKKIPKEPGYPPPKRRAPCPFCFLEALDVKILWSPQHWRTSHGIQFPWPVYEGNIDFLNHQMLQKMVGGTYQFTIYQSFAKGVSISPCWSELWNPTKKSLSTYLSWIPTGCNRKLRKLRKSGRFPGKAFGRHPMAEDQPWRRRGAQFHSFFLFLSEMAWKWISIKLKIHVFNFTIGSISLMDFHWIINVFNFHSMDPDFSIKLIQSVRLPSKCVEAWILIDGTAVGADRLFMEPVPG